MSNRNYYSKMVGDRANSAIQRFAKAIELKNKNNWKKSLANKHAKMIKELFPNMNSSTKLRVANRLRNILRNY